MKTYLVNKTSRMDITNLITSVTISGEYRSPSRSMSFGIVKSQYDKNTFVIPINIGDRIEVTVNDKVVFFGLIFSRNKDTNINEISYTCKDYGVYLLKNKYSYNFKNIKPEDITTKICKDFGIGIQSLYKTNKPISRVFLGCTLYEIIISSYNLGTDEKIMCIFDGMKLNVIKKGEILAPTLESGVNLLTTIVSESLDDMVNRVNVFDKNDKLVKTFEDSSDVLKFGLMSDYLKLSDGENTSKGQDNLHGIEQKISVTNFGNPEYITGKSVNLIEPYNGLQGLFFIDSDEHSFKNSIYSNKLTLNYQNISDETEGGT